MEAGIHIRSRRIVDYGFFRGKHPRHEWPSDGVRPNRAFRVRNDVRDVIDHCREELYVTNSPDSQQIEAARHPAPST